MILITGAFILAIFALLWAKLLHISVLIYYFLLGLITYLIYKKDKKASVNNTWRVPEKHLHILSLLGGWMGAVVAQKTIRHKTQKKVFKMLFFFTIFINIIVFTTLYFYSDTYLDR